MLTRSTLAMKAVEAAQAMRELPASLVFHKRHRRALRWRGLWRGVLTVLFTFGCAATLGSFVGLLHNPSLPLGIGLLVLNALVFAVPLLFFGLVRDPVRGKWSEWLASCCREGFGVLEEHVPTPDERLLESAHNLTAVIAAATPDATVRSTWIQRGRARRVRLTVDEHDVEAHLKLQDKELTLTIRHGIDVYHQSQAMPSGTGISMEMVERFAEFYWRASAENAPGLSRGTAYVHRGQASPPQVEAGHSVFGSYAAYSLALVATLPALVTLWQLGHAMGVTILSGFLMTLVAMWLLNPAITRSAARPLIGLQPRDMSVLVTDNWLQCEQHRIDLMRPFALHVYRQDDAPRWAAIEVTQAREKTRFLVPSDIVGAAAVGEPLAVQAPVLARADARSLWRALERRHDEHAHEPSLVSVHAHVES